MRRTDGSVQKYATAERVNTREGDDGVSIVSTCGGDQSTEMVISHDAAVDIHRQLQAILYAWELPTSPAEAMASTDTEQDFLSQGRKEAEALIPDTNAMDNNLTCVFKRAENTWWAVVDGTLIKADFNSKGAAEAGIEVERRRRNAKLPKAPQPPHKNGQIQLG